MTKQSTIMFHITISSIEDPDIYELLHAVSGRDRAARARALMRQGLGRPVAIAPSAAIPSMSSGQQSEHQPPATAPDNMHLVKEFDDFEFDIDQLMRNLAASRQEN